MKKIKVAQIGVGHDHAVCAISTLKRLNNIFDLIGFCIVPEDSENTCTFESNKHFFEGVKQMELNEILNYKGLDAVVIETEDRALTKYSLLAAEKGLNIQMDKPGGISDSDFDKLINTVKEYGKGKNLVFHTGYMYRYNPAVLKLKEDIANGKLGEIISVEAQMNCAHPVEKRNWLGNYPGGMMYFLGCHMVDFVYSIMGEPEEIIPFNCASGKGGTTSEDFGMAVFKYKHGVSIAKSSAVEVGGFERRQLVVVGTKGTVELCPLEWIMDKNPTVFSPQVTKIREAYDEFWHKKADYSESVPHDRYEAMFKAFASYVNKQSENPYSYEYERKLHKLLLKACGK